MRRLGDSPSFTKSSTAESKFSGAFRSAEGRSLREITTVVEVEVNLRARKTKKSESDERGGVKKKGKGKKKNGVHK